MFDTNASTAPNWALFLMPSSADFQQFPGYLFSGHSVLAAWTTTSQYLTISMAWKLLVLIFVLANMRHVPFVYHLRILNAIRFVCRSQRPKVDIKPEQIFQPLITSSRPCLMDIDVLGHKVSNTAPCMTIPNSDRAIQPILWTWMWPEFIWSPQCLAKASSNIVAVQP